MKTIRLIQDTTVQGNPRTAGTILHGLDNAVTAPLIASGKAEIVRVTGRVIALPDPKAKATTAKPATKKGKPTAGGAGPAAQPVAGAPDPAASPAK